MAPYKHEDDEEPLEVEEEEQWEWTDNITDAPPPPKQRGKAYTIPHTSVYRDGVGKFRIGDVVQLNTLTTYKWIGLLRGLETDYGYKRGQRKRAIVIWFNRQQDIPTKKRRPGAPAVTPFPFPQREFEIDV